MSTTIPNYMNYKGTITAGSGIRGSGVAATEIPYGAFVTRAADGTIEATPTLAGQHAYLGIAVDDARQQLPYDGFYAAGKEVPFVKTGTANAWLLGGQLALSGDFVKLGAALGPTSGATPLGVVVPETTLTRTVASVGRITEDSDTGDTDFDQPVTCTAGTTSVTVDSNAHLLLMELKEGDWVVIASSESAEVNRVVDPWYSSAVFTVEKPLLTHTTSPIAYKLTQLEVELI
jgi:hypothetical protein